MICQRSGLCCTTMPVVIRVGDRAKMKPGGVLCPLLVFEDGNATCSVHEEEWYKETPCFVYGNPDVDIDFEAKRGAPCPVGGLVQKRGGLKVFNPSVFEGHNLVKVEDLQDLGDWRSDDGDLDSPAAG